MKVEILEFIFIGGYVFAVASLLSVKSSNRGYFFALSLLLSYLSTSALFSTMLANTHSSITSDGVVETQYLLLAMLVVLIIYAPILVAASCYESKAATEVVLPPTLD